VQDSDVPRISVAVVALALAGCAAVQQPTPAGPTPVQLTPTPLAATPVATPTAEPIDPPTDVTPTPGTSAPAPFDPGAISLTFEPFAAGFGALTHVTHAADGSGRLYAVERAGRVHLIERDGTVLATPFLDITDRVSAGGERGLLGLAFHPEYADNGRLFVNYIDPANNTVVAEFARATEATADPASERQLLYLEQPFGNHNGGMVEFGPDGALYISSGDGGGGGDPLDAGQDLSTLLGAMLRIDVDSAEPYAIPADNPFVGQPDAAAEIWAWGLRNPWRFSFDALDGSLFIADVGQNRWEEINVEPAGAGGRNYGWNVMEGPECFGTAECDTTGLVMPVAWYSIAGDDCAVIGGYVYRGERYAALGGAYLLADHCSGVVRALDADAAKAGEPVELYDVGNAGLRVTTFGVDEAGDVYIAGLDGQILRLVAAGP
jgi:glucose/arabinose dehydrogenase